jgi:transposase
MRTFRHIDPLVSRMVFCFAEKQMAMANRPISMEVLKQIKLLSNLGVGKKTIARQLGISKNTVKDYLSKILDDQKVPTLSTSRISDLQSFFPYCKEELGRKGVTRQILWAEYKAKYPQGYSYSQFCEHFAIWMDNQQATLHIEQQPADKMYIDFTGDKLSIVDPQTGEINKVEVFVSVLGYSGLTYVKACPSQKKEDFLPCIAGALEYYNGVPKVLVPDNLKSAVTKANTYEPDINRDLLDLGNHYNMAIMPARSRKPRDKAWVERMVGIVYNRIFAPLRNRIFTNLTELNQAIAELVDVHNELPLQNRRESRRDLFEKDERPFLQPLPQQGYELKEYQKARVMKNSHIQLHKDRHYYSVPYKYIGQIAKVIYTNTYISVYCNNERVAYHLRDNRAHKYTTIKEHLPSTHQFVSDWNPEKFTLWASHIDPIVEKYIVKVLENKSYPEQTYRSCVGILSFDKKAGRDRLIAACRRASEYGSYNYKVIEQIINNRLDRQPIDDGQGTLPLHENIRGPQYYK